MKVKIIIMLLLALSVLSYDSWAQLEKTPANANNKKNQVFTSENPLILMDFEGRETVTKLGGMWGVFDMNPTDRQAFCRAVFSKDNDLHKTGYNLKITYDVDSPMACFNGLWVKLNGLDLSKFEAIAMKIRGDKEKGFTDFFKIEIKDKVNKLEYYLEDITDEWKEFIIPFNQMEGVIEEMDWTNMQEIIPCVFEDWKFQVKTGRIYIDDIRFIPKKGISIALEDILGKKKAAASTKDKPKATETTD